MSSFLADSVAAAPHTVWELDPFSTDDDNLLEFAEKMFEEFDLISTFKISIDKLKIFLRCARDKYRPVPFHNFKHGWSVLHMTCCILRQGAVSYLTPIDTLSVLIASLCHDLDHPGNNNAFEVATRSELALTHADDGVLEKHHLSTCLRLLHDPSCNILESLSSRDILEVRKLIASSIMATDMADHFKHVDELKAAASKGESCFDKTNFSDRKKLLGTYLFTL